MSRILALLIALLPAAALADVAGTARAVDGDTLEMGGQIVHLYGVDAPELEQTCRANRGVYGCGSAALMELDKIVMGRQLRCETRDTIQFGEIIAVCFIDNGEINALMVRRGWAVVDRTVPTTYEFWEYEARNGLRGVWKGPFLAPWDWRIRYDRVKPILETQCTIKGDLGPRAERLFYFPGHWAYDRVIINPGKGERWFCSAREAREAGWKHARSLRYK